MGASVAICSQAPPAFLPTIVTSVPSPSVAGQLSLPAATAIDLQTLASSCLERSRAFSRGGSALISVSDRILPRRFGAGVGPGAGARRSIRAAMPSAGDCWTT
jgi:hypothetical protein